MRIQKRKDELTRSNEALVADRFSSLEQSFNAKIAKKQELLESARNKHSAPQYIRMLEGGLRNLHQDFANKRDAIDKQRHLSIHFNTVAAGVLRIT